ncbi:hypothetical protein EP331_07515 [bacterium]|nr:MAG: hypothetical protein EP331_07515 [bacterium]
MKTPFNFKKFLIPVIALGTLSVACSDDNSSSIEASTADLEYAAAVVSSSLSDETDGLLAATYDATASVSSDGISYGNSMMKRGGNDHESDRGIGRNAQYTYDPETGTHTLSIERTMTNNRMSKTLSILMKHIYTHESGAFVVQPRVSPDSINSIYFTSTRSGSETATRRSGEFNRIDTLSMAGIASTAETLVLNGSHYGTGSMTVTLKDSTTINKYHDIYIKLTDVSIDKATVQANENLEEGVTGTIDYKMVTYNSNTDDSEVVVEGTITMTGDGTALMDFKGFAKKALITLQTGEFSFKN